MNGDTLKVGLVGANWGLTHIAAWRRVPGAEIAAICTGHRESAEKIAAEHGIPHAYWDAEKMIDERSLDIVDVTPRPIVRVPIAFAALREKKHLIQPLPFAMSLEQGKELLERAAAAGVVANVENLHRHAPAFLQAKTMIDEGFLGELYSVDAAVRTGIILNRPRNYVYQWTTEPQSATSSIRNFGAHMLHNLLWLFGDIVEVASSNAMRVPNLRFTDGSTASNGAVDTSLSLVRFAQGATGYLHASWSTPAGEGFSIDAMGSEGRIRLRADVLGPQGSVLSAARRTDEHLVDVPVSDRFRPLAETLAVDRDDHVGYALGAMCYHLTEAIRNDGDPRAGPSFAEAYRVMQIAEATYEASAQKVWVAV